MISDVLDVMVTAFLLAIDVGNTHTVVGVYDGDRLVRHWRVLSDPGRTSDEYGVLLWNLYRASELPIPRKSDIIVCSVVPPMTTVVEDLCRDYFHAEPLVVGPGVKTGMPILYDNPKEVGADRIVNAVAAYERYRQCCIVVDFGTATTFDVISADGAYLGGAIIPGVEISLNALFGRAAGLRRVELVPPRSVVGRTTVESIQSGVLYGTAAMVDGMTQRIVQELGGTATIVATGGLADVIAPHANTLDHLDPWITLHGLRLIWEKNQ